MGLRTHTVGWAGTAVVRLMKQRVQQVPTLLTTVIVRRLMDPHFHGGETILPTNRCTPPRSFPSFPSSTPDRKISRENEATETPTPNLHTHQITTQFSRNKQTPYESAKMVSRKNPNQPSKNRLAARAGSAKKVARQSSAAGQTKLSIQDRQRGANSGLLPTSGPRAALSKKKAKKLEQRTRLNARRRAELEAIEKGIVLPAGKGGAGGEVEMSG